MSVRWMLLLGSMAACSGKDPEPETVVDEEPGGDADPDTPTDDTAEPDDTGTGDDTGEGDDTGSEEKDELPDPTIPEDKGAECPASLGETFTITGGKGGPHVVQINAEVSDSCAVHTFTPCLLSVDTIYEDPIRPHVATMEVVHTVEAGDCEDGELVTQKVLMNMDAVIQKVMEEGAWNVGTIDFMLRGGAYRVDYAFEYVDPEDKEEEGGSDGFDGSFGGS